MHKDRIVWQLAAHYANYTKDSSGGMRSVEILLLNGCSERQLVALSVDQPVFTPGWPHCVSCAPGWAHSAQRACNRHVCPSLRKTFHDTSRRCRILEPLHTRNCHARLLYLILSTHTTADCIGMSASFLDTSTSRQQLLGVTVGGTMSCP